MKQQHAAFIPRFLDRDPEEKLNLKGTKRFRIQDTDGIITQTSEFDVTSVNDVKIKVKLSYRHVRPIEIVDDRPVIIYVHGVPTSKNQYTLSQRLVGPYVESYAIDTIGMGETTFEPSDAKWDFTWENDSIILNAFIEKLIEDNPKRITNNTRFIFYGDDWGGGEVLDFAARYSEMYPNSILVLQNPVAFDGWPVVEIEEIGRINQIVKKWEDPKFASQHDELEKQLINFWNSFPGTHVRTVKQMVHDPSVWNAFTLRRQRSPYENVDYNWGKDKKTEQTEEKEIEDERGYRIVVEEQKEGEDIRGDAEGNPYYGPDLSKGVKDQKFKNFINLVKRAAALNPKQMLDIKYENIRINIMIIWGRDDSMMPPQQAYWFKKIIKNATVTIVLIDDAGHFSNLDQPGKVVDRLLNFITQQFNDEALAEFYSGHLVTITSQNLHYMIPVGFKMETESGAARAKNNNTNRENNITNNKSSTKLSIEVSNKLETELKRMNLFKQTEK